MSEELKAAQARIARLEGEIAKRDETIARLEPQLNRAIQANYDLREELAACRVAVENCEVFRARIAELESRYQRDVWGLNNEGDPIGGEPTGGYANDNARLRTELAAIKAQGVVMPEGWIPLTIEHEPGYPEDVAFGPKRMMDRLKKWLDRYFEMRLNAAPVQRVSVPDGWRELAKAVTALDQVPRSSGHAMPKPEQVRAESAVIRAARAMLAAAPAAPAAAIGSAV